MQIFRVLAPAAALLFFCRYAPAAPTPAPPTPIGPAPTPFGGSGHQTDFNGDGTDDIAVFSPTSGKWSVRGYTRVYYGAGKTPMAGDYNGDGKDDVAVWDSVTGKWSVRGITRAYYGSSGDLPLGAAGSPWNYRSSGNIWFEGWAGIMQGNPADALHIGNGDGNFLIRVEAQAGGAAQLRLRRGSSSTWIGPSGDNEFDLVTAENIPVVIGNNLTANMVIDTSGRVGIGTASPAGRLHIKGSSDTLVRLEGQDAGGGTQGLSLTRTGEAGTRGGIWLTYSLGELEFSVGDGAGQNTEPLRIGPDQRVGIGDPISISYTLEVDGSAGKPGGGTWTAACDARLKRKVRSLSGTAALEKFGRLNGVTYEWINPLEHQPGVRAGVLAQNLDRVFPAWVVTVEAGGKDEVLTPGGAESVSFPQDFDAYLIEALKELRARNRALRARLDALEGRAGTL
ncbi:MAG TPA: tail fiber domain-containing protein [bacterium]|nr:tail fiber domain-containing protein [bacterium]HPQ65895.1 tail fiber domain-containing protein [bacterium]